MSSVKASKKDKVKTKKIVKEVSDDEVDESALQNDYMIKPSKGKAALDTAEWPLLLKVTSLARYSFSHHFTELRQNERPHHPLYSNSSRIRSIEQSIRGALEVWCHQPRQAFKPFLPRGRGLDQEDPEDR